MLSGAACRHWLALLSNANAEARATLMLDEAVADGRSHTLQWRGRCVRDEARRYPAHRITAPTNAVIRVLACSAAKK